MPIIETPRSDAPLSQGDILDGIPLFTSDLRKVWDEELSVRVGTGLCLVLSRPCVCLHKPQIVVSEVTSLVMDKAITVAESFDDIKDILTDLRDGVSAPDTLYIGPLPGKQGKFRACLDSIYTLTIPDNPDARLEFCSRTRIARMCDEYVRDLHIRLTRSFASLGFDDHKWLCIEDLATLVAKGKHDRMKLKTEVADFESQLAMSQNQIKLKPSHEQNLLQSKSVAEKKLEELDQILAPFEAELKTRGE